MVFATINQIKKKGIPEYIMQEKARMSEIALDFMGKKTAMETSQRMANLIGQLRGPENGDPEVEDLIPSLLL